MTITELPSGSYRIRQQYKGKRYSIVVDHKPTNKEALLLMAKTMENAPTTQQNGHTGSLEDMLDKYISKCIKAHKSPATVRGYESIKRNIPEWLKEINIYDITENDIKLFVEEYGKTRSPKSVRMAFSLVHSVVKVSRPTFKCDVLLPQVKKSFEYQPTTKDIKRIIEHSKPSRYYLFLRLSAIGLRRGEIACLTADDLNEDNVLTINKDMVLDKDNNYVIKNCAKTDASNRRILIPSEIADDIRRQGKVFDGNLHTVNEYLHKCQDRLNIPRFRLHIMRHFAAAYLLKNGMTTQQVEDYMGWEHGSEIMQKVYAYNLDPEESQKDIAETLSELF